MRAAGPGPAALWSVVRWKSAEPFSALPQQNDYGLGRAWSWLTWAST